jgi:ribonuclease HI
MANIKKVYVDGTSKGNPGLSAIGIYITEDDIPIFMHGEVIGRSTNNKAEYIAVIKALELCLKNGFLEIELLSDSELIVKQLNKEYRVKSKELLPLYRKARSLIEKFKKIEIKKIPKKENHNAHVIADKALWE